MERVEVWRKGIDVEVRSRGRGRVMVVGVFSYGVLVLLFSGFRVLSELLCLVVLCSNCDVLGYVSDCVRCHRLCLLACERGSCVWLCVERRNSTK